MVRENLLSWHSYFVGGKRKKSWRAAPSCLLWTLWKERNRRSVKDNEKLNQTIKYSSIASFLEWVKLYIGFVDWLCLK